MTETSSRKRSAEGLSAFFQNIIARKQTREQLQFQATILRNVSESVIVTDLQGHIVYWNEGATSIFGYTAEEMMDSTPAILYPEAAQAQFVPDIRQTREGKDYIGEWRGRRKDGTAVWIDIKTTVLRNTRGEDIGFIGVAKDITARKVAEEALLSSEERLRLALEAGNIGVWDWDVEHNTVTWSQRVYELHGVSKDSFVVTLENFLTLVHPEDQARVQQAIEQSLTEHAPFNIHFRTVTPQGETRWITISASVTYDPAGNPIRMLGATSDITQQKELEQRKDDFIGMASHELKTPITTLKGLTQLLKRGLKKQGLSEPVLVLSKMEIQIDRLTRLVNDLLDVTKIQAGRLNYAEERLALDTLIRDIVETIQLMSPTHTLTMYGASNSYIVGDGDRLGQVFLNLIDNAIKYSPKANKVDIHVTSSENAVTVSVRDYGVGIPKEHQSKIFDRFYRVSDERMKAFPGLGMGLYISYEIVERHGGEIWVASEEGEGSTFAVSLPILKEAVN
jgi:PAS domain S-box-containing protein